MCASTYSVYTTRPKEMSWVTAVTGFTVVHTQYEELQSYTREHKKLDFFLCTKNHTATFNLFIVPGVTNLKYNFAPN